MYIFLTVAQLKPDQRESTVQQAVVRLLGAKGSTSILSIPFQTVHNTSFVDTSECYATCAISGALRERHATCTRKEQGGFPIWRSRENALEGECKQQSRRSSETVPSRSSHRASLRRGDEPSHEWILHVPRKRKLETWLARTTHRFHRSFLRGHVQSRRDHESTSSIPRYPFDPPTLRSNGTCAENENARFLRASLVVLLLYPHSTR